MAAILVTPLFYIIVAGRLYCYVFTVDLAKKKQILIWLDTKLCYILEELEGKLDIKGYITTNC